MLKEVPFNKDLLCFIVCCSNFTFVLRKVSGLFLKNNNLQKTGLILQGVFLHWASKKLKYGKPRLGFHKFFSGALGLLQPFHCLHPLLQLPQKRRLLKPVSCHLIIWQSAPNQNNSFISKHILSSRYRYINSQYSINTMYSILDLRPIPVFSPPKFKLETTRGKRSVINLFPIIFFWFFSLLILWPFQLHRLRPDLYQRLYNLCWVVVVVLLVVVVVVFWWRWCCVFCCWQSKRMREEIAVSCLSRRNSSLG